MTNSITYRNATNYHTMVHGYYQNTAVRRNVILTYLAAVIRPVINENRRIKSFIFEADGDDEEEQSWTNPRRVVH